MSKDFMRAMEQVDEIDNLAEHAANRFGFMVHPLPSEYSRSERLAADKRANAWSDRLIGYEADYICHLTDVIKELTRALRRAAYAAECESCTRWKNGECCVGGCNDGGEYRWSATYGAEDGEK